MEPRDLRARTIFSRQRVLKYYTIFDRVFLAFAHEKGDIHVELRNTISAEEICPQPVVDSLRGHRAHGKTDVRSPCYRMLPACTSPLKQKILRIKQVPEPYSHALWTAA